MNKMMRLVFTMAFILLNQCMSEKCSDTEFSLGVSTLAAFTACSDFSSEEVMVMAGVLDSYSLSETLNTAVENCLSMSEGDEKLECFSSFMGLLAINGLFISDAVADDEVTRSLSNTCGCLTAAFGVMPNCDQFAPFFFFNDVLPVSENVCSEISLTCDSIASGSKLCLTDSDEYSTEFCQNLLTSSQTCEENLDVFWAGGMYAAEMCGLKEFQTERLRNYFDSCPSSPETTVEKDTSRKTSNWTQIFIGYLAKVLAILVLLSLILGLNRCFKSRNSLDAYSPIATEDKDLMKVSRASYTSPGSPDDDGKLHGDDDEIAQAYVF